MPETYVEFENATDGPINLHIDWKGTAASMNTTIQAGEVIEISGFNPGVTATICHRNDGGTYTNCPLGSPTARGGDYFILEHDGGFSG